MQTLRFLALSALALMTTHALAGDTGPQPIPEPGTWALIALAGVIGVVVARNKRK
jgi:hypothetical protein